MPQSNNRKQQLRKHWTGENSFATTLLLLFIDAYGTEALQWDPATILLEIQDDFDVELPPANQDRLLTAINLVVTDAFYKSLPDFVNFCNILNGDCFDPKTWEPADAQDIAWGITEALLIEPPDEDDPFVPDITSYIGTVLDQEGIIQPPDVLRIAVREQDLAAKVRDDFADDPEMFDAVYKFEQSKREQINQYVRDNLAELSQQLDGLTLASGQAKDIVHKLLTRS
jgi:hypothetical protein